MASKLLSSALGCLCSRPTVTRAFAPACARRPIALTARPLYSCRVLTPSLHLTTLTGLPSRLLTCNLTELPATTLFAKFEVIITGFVAGCASQSRSLLLQQQRHRGVSQRHALTTVRAGSSIPEEPKTVQRKVSHILVKRDQEHLLDEIEDRLAGAYKQTRLCA